MNFRQVLLFNLLIFKVLSLSFAEEKSISELLGKLKKCTANDSTRYCILFQLSQNYINADSSVFYAQQLLDESKTKNNVYWQINAYHQLGNAFAQKGDYNQATKALFESAELSKKHSNYSGVIEAYFTLAGIYTISKNYDSALRLYNEAFLEALAKNDSGSIANILLNKGSLFLVQENFDSALYLFNKAYKIYLGNKNVQGIAYSLGNIARINSEKGYYREALDNLGKAIEMLETIGDYYAISSFKIRMAKIAQEQKKYDLALTFAGESYSIALDKKLMPQLRDACLRLALIYTETDDFSKAYEYQSLYYTYRDSIINEETIRKMADLRTEYEVSQKQLEIDALVKDKKVQRAIGISLAAILMLTAGLIVILSIHSKHNRKFSEKLAEQKEELQRQHDLLEELNKTKDRFFSIISHDLRGPIGVLNGTTLLIREYLESKDYKQLSDLTANMEYSVKKVQHLLDNLLEWAISQQGKFNYNPERVEINEVINEVLGIFEGMAFSKNISVKYVCKYDKLYLITDRNSLLTIIRNLVSNALKFTQRNGVITIMVYKTEKTVAIKISDTGVGISQKKIKTLFKIDENKSTWGTEREKGLGIGLSLVHEFVTMNHGIIEVESEEGVGSTFTIKFPTETIQKQMLVPQDV